MRTARALGTTIRIAPLFNDCATAEENFTAIDSPSLQFLPRGQEAAGWVLEEDPIVVPGNRLAAYLDRDASHFGGAQLEGCNEHLNLTRPDVIRAIHEAYLDAGADLISPNSFGCAPYVLAEYGLADRCHEITLAGARLARAAGRNSSIVSSGP